MSSADSRLSVCDQITPHTQVVRFSIVRCLDYSYALGAGPGFCSTVTVYQSALSPLCLKPHRLLKRKCRVCIHSVISHLVTAISAVISEKVCQKCLLLSQSHSI